MAANSPASIEELLRQEGEKEALREDRPLSFWRIAMIRLSRDRLTLAAFGLLLVIVLLSVGADWINATILDQDPNDTNLIDSLLPPSADHWLGTDDLGQDQLARLLVGGRVSLMICFFGALFTVILGITIGMVAAFFGGIVDDLIMWFINTLIAIPALFLFLIVGALFELNPFWLTILFASLGWPFTSRLVRSTVFSMREREFVTASRALGASSASTMFRHILPNVIPIVIIAATRRLGTLVLAEAALSFLGFGVRPPTPTWGNMLTEAQQYILREDAIHLVIYPGIMITLTVLAIYIIGDGLRDALDPRLK